MKTKILLALPVAVLLAWVAALQISFSTAEKIVLPVEGYDPRDLLRGRYLRVRMLYPADSPHKDCCNNIRRFYVSENKAFKLERALNGSAVKAEMVVALPKYGAPAPVDLLLDGKSWRDF